MGIRGLQNLEKLSERKVSKFFALLFVLYKKQEKAAKPQKDLILFARICCFGALIRGLQNLGTPCEGDVFTFFLQGASRFSKPQFSAPQRQLRTATIKTFPGRFEVLQTSNQRTQATTSHNPIKPFCRLRRLFVLFIEKILKTS